MTPDRRRNIAQEKAYVELMMTLGDVELWLKQSRQKDALIPPDWHRVERDVPVRPRKAKLTAALDADMVKWFRGMGLGYQARMNSVLRSFMLACISKEILGRTDRDWKHDPIWGIKRTDESL